MVVKILQGFLMQMKEIERDGDRKKKNDEGFRQKTTERRRGRGIERMGKGKDR